MNSNRNHVIGLMILILFLGVAGARDAEAGIRVDARIHTSGPAIRITTGHDIQVRPGIHIRRSLPRTERRCIHVKISKQDRKVAGRLSRYTGVPKHELLRLRRDGYRWNEIGRWLEVSRHAVRASMHARTWQHYLRHGRRTWRCGN